MKKSIHLFISLLLLLGAGKTFAQEKNTSYHFTYSPNYSKLLGSNGYLVGGVKGKFSQNIFFMIEYQTKKRINPTIALGLVNTGHFDDQTYHYPLLLGNGYYRFNHTYFVALTGARINIKKYFIHPEIGLGFYLDGNLVFLPMGIGGPEEKMRVDYESWGKTNYTVSIPFFLSFGREFDLGKVNLTAGAKYYLTSNSLYSDWDRNPSTWGLGLLTGVKF